MKGEETRKAQEEAARTSKEIEKENLKDIDGKKIKRIARTRKNRPELKSKFYREDK